VLPSAGACRVAAGTSGCANGALARRRDLQDVVGYGVAPHDQPAAAGQGALPELLVDAFGVVAGVDRIDPAGVVFCFQAGVGFGGVAEVRELFVVADAAVGQWILSIWLYLLACCLVGLAGGVLGLSWGVALLGVVGWLGLPGCRGFGPARRLAFLCFAKEESAKERRAVERAPAGYLALLGFVGVVAQTRCAQTCARPDPPNPALLSTLQWRGGGGEPRA